jgi:hypothetical protein
MRFLTSLIAVGVLCTVDLHGAVLTAASTGASLEATRLGDVMFSIIVAAMAWFDVDGARARLTYAGGKPPSRKVLYNMVDDGLRVARIGRRLWFCDAWIDDYLESKASGKSRTQTDVAAGVGR